MSFAQKIPLPEEMETPVHPDDEARIEVVVYCYGYRMLSAPGRTIGARGVFVRADLSRLPEHSYLEVGFRLCRTSGSRQFRIPVFRHVISKAGTELRLVFPSEHAHELRVALDEHLNVEERRKIPSRPRYS